MSPLDDALATIALSDRYRVLQRIDRCDEYGADGRSPKIGMIVDVETTGLDSATDEIIEFGCVTFEYHDGYIGTVLHSGSWFRQPSKPIPEEITRITGITDEMVAGQTLPNEHIAGIASQAAIVIAHHASFDRPFVEHEFPWAVDKHWGCSLEDIDWKGMGAPSGALEALAWWMGYFYDAHRAEEDCRALLHLLAQRNDYGTGSSFLKNLLATAAIPTYRLKAVGSPYEIKDVLKARGYRWNAGAKVWFCDFREEDAAEKEHAWLVTQGVTPHLGLFTAKTRYSEREK